MARISIFGSFAVAALAALALAAALATLINVITAVAPPYAGGNCDRKCVEGETRTCQFDFEVHRYQTYSWACRECENASCSSSRECVKGDGVTRFITVVNKRLPGPSIQVCEGDTIKVTVRNQLPSAGVAIHWHGMLMRGVTLGSGTPHMDGVPGVTQCPIMPHSKFTYTYTAYPSGTHFWHAQTGFQRGDGVFGSLVVRSPKHRDPNHHLYDKDLSSHVIMINDWTHILAEEKFCLRHLSGFSDYPKSILINGFGPHEGNSITSIPKPVAHQRFKVERGKKYRFRLISGAFLNCPVVVSVNDHMLTVISADGSPIEPVNVTSIVIHPGERWDFVLDANQYPQPYWMVFMGMGDCSKDSVFQSAILDYVEEEYGESNERKNMKDVSPPSKPKYSYSKPRGKQVNSITEDCQTDNVCLTDLRSRKSLPESLSLEQADVTHYFAFNKRNIRDSIHNHPYFFNYNNAPERDQIPVPQINNFTFLSSSSPLLLQDNIYGTCNANLQKCQSNFCECIHLVKIPRGAVTDLVIIDEGDGVEGNTIHFHGYKFYILYQESSPYPKTTNHTREAIMALDKKGMIHRNLDNPIAKDTVPLPPGGFIVLRFLADNPGFWTLQSQLLFYSEAGMKLVMQVGEKSQMPAAPDHFPQCGDFI